MTAREFDSDPNSPRIILCVDDEQNILNSLQRLLRQTGCKVLTATGGNEALAMLKGEASCVVPALVISDQRMPVMTGDEFLGRVRELVPDSIRILLTGYADLSGAIAAVNNGGLFRYMTKPWDDKDLLSTVQSGLLQHDLVRQNRRLQAETRRQNDELAGLNATLEERVVERTKTIELRHEELTRLYELLEKDLGESLAMLLRVMEVHSPRLVGHGRRVSAHVQRVGPLLGLVPLDVKTAVTGAMLHDLGLIGVPHEILDKPDLLLSEPERTLIRQHPRIGAESVTPLSRFKTVASLIKSHHERFDGQGYPDGLKGDGIPIGAMVIAVADEYDHIVAPFYGLPIPTLEQEAIKVLQEERGRAFNPAVVDAFVRSLSGPAVKDRNVSVLELGEGMVLEKNLTTPQGVLLAPKGMVLTRAIVQRLQQLPEANRPREASVAA